MEERGEKLSPSLFVINGGNKMEELKKYAETLTEMVEVSLEDEEITVSCEESKNKLLEDDFSLQIRFYGKEIGMCMWMREYFLADISVEDAADHICKEYYKAREQILGSDGPVIPFDICDYEVVKDYIYPVVYEAGSRGPVYKQIEGTNLGMYLRIMFTSSAIGKGSILIRDAMLSAWNVSLEQVVKVAEDNLKKLPAFIMDITMYYLEGKRAEVYKPSTVLDGNMYVLTCSENMFDGSYGASAILNSELLEQVAQSFDGDFYILPSSIYEVIVVRERGCDVDFLEDIVKVVNREEVSALDKLSDGVYKYSDGRIIQVA